MVLPKYARIKSPFILITELYSLDFIVSFWVVFTVSE
jgi:hypothetical protein